MSIKITKKSFMLNLCTLRKLNERKQEREKKVKFMSAIEEIENMGEFLNHKNFSLKFHSNCK